MKSTLIASYLLVGTSLIAGPWSPQPQGTVSAEYWSQTQVSRAQAEKAAQPVDNVKQSLQLLAQRHQQAIAYENWRKQEVKRIEIESAKNEAILQKKAERLNAIKEKADANDAKFFAKQNTNGVNHPFYEDYRYRETVTTYRSEINVTFSFGGSRQPYSEPWGIEWR